MQALKTEGGRDFGVSNVESGAFERVSELDGICRGDGGDLNISGRARGMFGRGNDCSTSTGDNGLGEGVASTRKGVDEGPMRPGGSYRGLQWVQGAEAEES